MSDVSSGADIERTARVVVEECVEGKMKGGLIKNFSM